MGAPLWLRAAPASPFSRHEVLSLLAGAPNFFEPRRFPPLRGGLFGFGRMPEFPLRRVSFLGSWPTRNFFPGWPFSGPREDRIFDLRSPPAPPQGNLVRKVAPFFFIGPRFQGLDSSVFSSVTPPAQDSPLSSGPSDPHAAAPKPFFRTSLVDPTLWQDRCPSLSEILGFPERPSLFFWKVHLPNATF